MSSITSDEALVPVLQIRNAANKMLVKLNQDGTIEYGEHYDPDEAAKIFWEAMMQYMPSRVNQIG